MHIYVISVFSLVNVRGWLMEFKHLKGYNI
jgi:hypothetical protein